MPQGDQADRFADSRLPDENPPRQVRSEASHGSRDRGTTAISSPHPGGGSEPSNASTGCYFIRFGVAGYVGRFASEIPRELRRGDRVVARTSRGLELAEVLGPAGANPEESDAFGDSIDGVILRPVLDTDNLLQVRLARYRDRAFDACRAWLDQNGIAGTLVDVEHLLDGESLYFHFLGDPPELDFAASEELAALYEKKIHFRRFAETLQQGCGPGCGTESAANGCATGGCSTCATGCGVKKARSNATAS